MVTVLIADAGTLDVEFCVNTVSFHADVEELVSDGSGNWGVVAGVMDTH